MSPWVLPVCVVSAFKTANGHASIKKARCTIDTGNLQGNLASHEFLEDVLGFGQSSLSLLTEEEKGPCGTTTGQLDPPEGEINLTWYHQKSTRVYRNMRFLVTSTDRYDMIIGAHSIRSENLLDVPNLMAHNPIEILQGSSDEEEEDQGKGDRLDFD